MLPCVRFPDRERAGTARAFVDSASRDECSPRDRGQQRIRRECRHSRESMVPFVRELGESGWSLRPLDRWPASGPRSLLRGSYYFYIKYIKREKKKKNLNFRR